MSEPISRARAAAKAKRAAAEPVIVRIAQLPPAEGLPLPRYQTPGAAGLDLVAAVPPAKPLKIAAGRHALVPTGLVIELPAGWEAQVRPRSGLALKHGVTVLNSPGTIDSDYRGEVGIILINHGSKPFAVERGERIAQLVIAPAPQARLVTASIAALGQSARGSGGFGSTGTASAAVEADRAAKARSKSGKGKSGKDNFGKAQVAKSADSASRSKANRPTRKSRAT